MSEASHPFAKPENGPDTENPAFGSAPDKVDWRSKIDALLDRGSEWMNPILVKESRQAFKSRQFMATFSLLLVCCWLWSLFVVAAKSPGIYFAPAGRDLLLGYYLIMVFPLVIIIPFSAFRSLAGERDDGTYELLSISTLKPRQIVTGKLSSSMLQMLIYLSVLAPCMAFTYLLRGIDIASIILIVFYAALTCWTLCSLGLMLATLTGPRHWQVFASVFFILLLAVIWFSVSGIGAGLISESTAVNVESGAFWIVNGMIVSTLVGFSSMFILAATARIRPRSENRSTALRVGMLACHLAYFLWCMVAITWGSDAYSFTFGEDFVVFIYQLFAAIGFAVFGALMVGEDHLLSPRIRRGLPKSSLGRLFGTLFFPGPGTGYLYAISNFAMILLGCSCLAIHCDSNSNVERIMVGGWVLVCYAVIYLGLAQMILRMMRKRSSAGPVLGLLTTTILIGLSSLIAMIAQVALWTDDYTFLQLPNLIWTYAEIIDGGRQEWVAIPLTLAAFVVFVINLAWMSSQLDVERSMVPARVKEEDALANPVGPEEKKRTSPWDDDE